MAMLAEPRRKQKVINLRAQNNAWSNDNTKFGQRMLEKMGWTSGKGLGAKENGITEHVVARYKNDEKGLGFEDKNDQWTKHEDDFNSLLANLSNATDNTENLHSGISLEVKSKKSKARIHYHKFTRGKDISRYSEKDLANIFGKKSFKNTEATPKPLKEEIKKSKQIFTEKGSMEDYFKNKLAMFKSKNRLKISSALENDAECDELGYGFCGFSQDTDNKEFHAGLGCNGEDESNTVKINLDCDVENFKKKKRKSKNMDNFCVSSIVNENSQNAQEQHDEHQIQESIEEKIKKKKIKNKIQPEDNEGDTYQVVECIEEKIKKKKSKNKHKNKDNDGQEQLQDYSNGHEITVQTANDSIQIIKNKKRSKKDKINESSHINNIIESEVDLVSQCKEVKSSKNKAISEESIVPCDFMKKKKSKRKNEHNIEDVTQYSNVEHLPKKKKKKKCKKNEQI